MSLPACGSTPRPGPPQQDQARLRARSGDGSCREMFYTELGEVVIQASQPQLQRTDEARQFPEWCNRGTAKPVLQASVCHELYKLRSVPSPQDAWSWVIIVAGFAWNGDAPQAGRHRRTLHCRDPAKEAYLTSCLSRTASPFKG